MVACISLKKCYKYLSVMKTDSLSPPKERAFVKAFAIAKHYNTTPATIYKWAKEKKIPSVSFQGTVRFDMEAVRAVIEGAASTR